MSIRSAFFAVCNDAKPAAGSYVSLYCSVPYFGGPEEGGWWGSDTVLIAYQWFATEETAEAAKVKVHEQAEELNQQESREHGEYCQRQMDWLDERGLDADYLPENDGESRYFVTLEQMPGESVSEGCRHYE